MSTFIEFSWSWRRTVANGVTSNTYFSGFARYLDNGLHCVRLQSWLMPHQLVHGRSEVVRCLSCNRSMTILNDHGHDDAQLDSPLTANPHDHAHADTHAHLHDHAHAKIHALPLDHAQAGVLAHLHNPAHADIHMRLRNHAHRQKYIHMLTITHTQTVTHIFTITHTQTFTHIFTITHTQIFTHIPTTTNRHLYLLQHHAHLHV